MSHKDSPVSRRKAIAILGTGVVSGLSGCSVFQSREQTSDTGPASQLGDAVTERPSQAAVTFDGEGSTASPYQVSTVGQLQYVARTDQQAHYKQTADIDARGTDLWDGPGFRPIITPSGGGFSGVYDGNGKSIRGLSIEGPLSRAGLFEIVGSRGVVKNVSLENVDITAERAGGIAGDIVGSVSNVSVTGTVYANSEAGGIASRVSQSGSVSSPSVDVRVTSRSQFAGGVTGTLSGSGEVINATVSGRVRGGSVVGGISGVVESDSRLRGTVCDATVSAATRSCGGIVGLVSGRGSVFVSLSQADVESTAQAGGVAGRVQSGRLRRVGSEGVVTGDTQVGGVVGRLAGGATDIYSTGAVTGNRFVGGLFGVVSGRVSRGYTVSPVTPAEPDQLPEQVPLGGVVGSLSRNARLSSVYWDGIDSEYISRAIAPTAGDAPSAAVINVGEGNLSGDEARTTLSGFDFETVWRIRDDGAPVLQSAQISETGSPSPASE